MGFSGRYAAVFGDEAGNGSGPTGKSASVTSPFVTSAIRRMTARDGMRVSAQ
jgi:hypothetical protein